MAATAFPTVNDYIAELRQLDVDYGTDAVTGELVAMYNRLRVAGIDSGELFDYVDDSLGQRVGWTMDKAGFLYML